ncbi:MAG TPA: hypothetical protein V6C63_03635 [Allocoleopsis sp.]
MTDVYQGTYGNDNYEYEGYDSLTAYGKNGDDTLYGNYKDDYLYGEKNNDYLYGRDGNDYLNAYGGGQELDWASGGYGSDTFVLGDDKSVYYTGDQSYLTVTDWDSSDYIQLHGDAYTHSYGYSQYTFDYSQNLGGTSAYDTTVYWGNDKIGVVYDSQVDFSRVTWV